MCVVSMVMDHYKPIIPEPDWYKPQVTPLPFIPPKPIEPVDLSDLLGIKQTVEELRALIKEFREAVAAAKTVDKLTGQPDCEDPEKAKLEERVERLEKMLAERDAAAGY